MASHGRQRLPGFGRLGVDHVVADGGLHGDHAHRVRDDVVQFAGDAQTLLGHGPARLFLALAFEPFGPRPASSVHRARRPTQVPAGQPGHSEVVRVRTPDASRLLEVLAAAGMQVRLVDASTVEAKAATADAVGIAAAAAGVTILELSRHDEDLESLFFDLVQQNPRNQEIAA